VKRMLLASLALILCASPAVASNHALYVQLRWQRRAEFYHQRDLEMIQREQQKAYSRKKQREAKAVELAARQADRAHPARAFGEEPEHRVGVPENQMKAMADKFRGEHGVVLKPRRAK
jgi:hypothetical protein